MLSSKDQWLSSFTYDNMSQLIPGLNKQDYSNIIKGGISDSTYQIGDFEGKVGLSISSENKNSSLILYPIEKFKSAPEIISNTIIGDSERNELEKGKYVLLHNNKVAHRCKADQSIECEPISNFGLPNKIGDIQISNESKVSILNGEKVPIQVKGSVIELQKIEGKLNVNMVAKGLNPEQHSFIENYITRNINTPTAEKEKLNLVIIKSLAERYYPNNKEAKEKELTNEFGLKGDISEKIKKWMIKENNQSQKKDFKHVKEKDHSILKNADNKKEVSKVLDKSMKTVHQKTEKSVGKTREIISIFSQGM